MRFYYLLFIFYSFSIQAQITESFDDGEFTSNPTWFGSTSDFIVNLNNELQLNATAAGVSFLSLPHGLTSLDDKEWRFRVKQSFSPSGSNFGRVYLVSNSPDLSTDPDGFYVLFGEAGANDAIRLFKVEAGTHTELLSGTIGQLAASFDLQLKVTHTVSGDWELFYAQDVALGYTYIGSVNESFNLLGTHFGMIDTYTASNATKFYYDDIYIGDVIVDLDPPIMTNLIVVNANQLDVYFNEQLDQSSAENIGNYSILPTLTISNAALDLVDNSLVHLTLSQNMSNSTNGILSSENIADLNGNNSVSQQLPFTYLVSENADRRDVIITEFMCDPTPAIGLPEVEYIELFNTSNKVFNLENWILSDNSSSGTCSSKWLLPNEYIVLVAKADTVLFSNACGVSSFPSLNNAGDGISISTDNGALIDSLQYTDEWYTTESDGGYSLELINTNDPCSDKSNWSISVSLSGGTPANQNSIFDNSIDTDAPAVTQVIVSSPFEVQIIFNEPIDTAALNIGLFSVPDLTVSTINVINLSTINVQFVEEIELSKLYELTISILTDCWTNSTTVTASFIRPDLPLIGDLLINEIMFNPVSGSSDWVEVYNNSDKVINLENIKLGNFSSDTIGSIKIVNQHYLISPGEYVLFSEDSNDVQYAFNTHGFGNFINMDLPSYSNDSGSVYLMHDTVLLEKVSYSEDWHFQLLDDFDGKSLERIDFSVFGDDPNNWHTASEAIGFGTPGLANSQFKPAIDYGELVLESTTVSPDGDGFEDVLRCSFRLPENGMVATVAVYDSQGRKIKILKNSELMAAEGYFVWDGLKEDQSKADIGSYILIFEAFDLNGERKVLKKKVFAVAGKL